MKLVCPSCGATHSVEAWQNDAQVRYFLNALTALPAPVQQRALPYCGLFRQGTKALPWRRALVVIQSLKDLVDTGTVHWQGGETRPCTAEIWGQAMEATIAAGPKNLKNHNYLRRICWELAAELAAKAEADRENSRRKRHQEEEEQPAPMSEATRRAVEDLKKKWGER